MFVAFQLLYRLGGGAYLDVQMAADAVRQYVEESDFLCPKGEPQSDRFSRWRKLPSTNLHIQFEKGP